MPMSNAVSPMTMVVSGAAPASAIACCDHRRVRLGRVAVGGLQRDEALREAVAVEAERQPAVRLAGRDREQPAVRLERIEQLGNAVEQRLFDAPLGAGALEMLLVAFGEHHVPFALLIRASARQSLRPGSGRSPAADVRRRDGEAMLAERVRQSGMNVRAAVHQRPVAIEDRRACSWPAFISAMAATMSARPAPV